MSEIARMNLSQTEFADMPDLEQKLRAGLAQQTNFAASEASISPSRKTFSNLERQYTNQKQSQMVELEKKMQIYPKKMTSVQIHELISEIYETKVKSDIKNLETKMPRRTIEQHCHELFKTKFGLKASLAC